MTTGRKRALATLVAFVCLSGILSVHSQGPEIQSVLTGTKPDEMQEQNIDVRQELILTAAYLHELQLMQELQLKVDQMRIDESRECVDSEGLVQDSADDERSASSPCVPLVVILENDLEDRMLRVSSDYHKLVQRLKGTEPETYLNDLITHFAKVMQDKQTASSEMLEPMNPNNLPEQLTQTAPSSNQAVVNEAPQLLVVTALRRHMRASARANSNASKSYNEKMRSASLIVIPLGFLLIFLSLFILIVRIRSRRLKCRQELAAPGSLNLLLVKETF